jgi:hypothetical protein
MQKAKGKRQRAKGKMKKAKCKVQRTNPSAKDAAKQRKRSAEISALTTKLFRPWHLRVLRCA